MSALHPFTCVFKGCGLELSVLRLVVHHEVARLPEAWLLVHADAIKVGEGPYTLALKNELTGEYIDGLDASAWYVNEATRMPSSIHGTKDRWLLRLGVMPSQRLPMRALVAEAQSAQDILREMCEARGRLPVAWAGPTFERRLGTVLSFQEALETFLRRFAASINCWFVYAGKAGMRFTQEGLNRLGESEPCLVRSAAVTTLAAPPEVRVFWSMNREPVLHDSEATAVQHAYEVVQATEIAVPQEPMAHWARSAEWVLHHGVSDSAAHFALRAGQSVGAQSRCALAVLHVWSASETGVSTPTTVCSALEGAVQGLLLQDLAHYVAADTNYATVALSVEQADALRQPDGAFLLAHKNLRAVARQLCTRLDLGAVDWTPPQPQAAGAVPATVTEPGGKTKQVLKENDYAALHAFQSPDLRSARVKVRFDWHPQAVEVPYASPWAGAGGTVFFPHRSGDRVLVQFINGDLSAPVVVAALSPEKAPVQDAFQSPGEPFHAHQPQGISARDGLVFETTESGDLVLYAQQGNLILRARDRVVMQGRVLTQNFARRRESGNTYDREKKE